VDDWVLVAEGTLEAHRRKGGAGSVTGVVWVRSWTPILLYEKKCVTRTL
jgi:hypothetical protein